MLISDKKEEIFMEKNLTTGSVFKNVILFSLPYLLSYFLQTLYDLADTFLLALCSKLNYNKRVQF